MSSVCNMSSICNWDEPPTPTVRRPSMATNGSMTKISPAYHAEQRRLLIERLPFRDVQHFEEWLASPNVCSAWDEFRKDFLESTVWNDTLDEADKRNTCESVRAALATAFGRHWLFNSNKDEWGTHAVHHHTVLFMARVVWYSFAIGLGTSQGYHSRPDHYIELVYDVLQYLRDSLLVDKGQRDGRNTGVPTVSQLYGAPPQLSKYAGECAIEDDLDEVSSAPSFDNWLFDDSHSLNSPVDDDIDAVHPPSSILREQFSHLTLATDRSSDNEEPVIVGEPYPGIRQGYVRLGDLSDEEREQWLHGSDMFYSSDEAAMSEFSFCLDAGVPNSV